MLGEDSEPFSEGSMGTDLHPYPDGSTDALMDVSQSNTYYMSAPASGPMEYGEPSFYFGSTICKLSEPVSCEFNRPGENSAIRLESAQYPSFS
jgi:hypothetical protein